MNYQIQERVELPEPGIANRVVDAIIYGKEGNKYGGSFLSKETESDQTNAF